MRAISLHQPWASFVAYGFKPYETRHWRTDYTGPLLIHAAMRKMDNDDFNIGMEIFAPGNINWYHTVGIPFGCFVCVVDMLGCLPGPDLTDAQFRRSNGLGDFGKGSFAWEFANVRRFKRPIPSPGRQRFWNYALGDPELVSQPWRSA